MQAVKRSSVGFLVGALVCIGCHSEKPKAEGVPDERRPDGGGIDASTSSDASTIPSSGGAGAEAGPLPVGSGGSAGAFDGGNRQDDAASDAATDASDGAPHEPSLGSGVPAGETPGIEYFAPLGQIAGWITDIAADSAGNVWFAIEDVIGKMTPAGVVTTFHAPYPDAGAAGALYLAAGADENMWFSTNYASVGRVTPSGEFTFFRTHESGMILFEVATGADGNLWFDEPSLGKIAKMTTAGDVTDFDVGAGSPLIGLPLPVSLAVGASGDAWFPRSAGDAGSVELGRHAANGVVTSFATSYTSVAVDSMNAAWFTNASLDPTKPLVLGNIDSSDTVRRFTVNCPSTKSIPTQDNHGQVARGLGGAIWFTEARTATLGRIDPNTLTTTCIHAFGGDKMFGLTGYPERIAPSPDGSVWFLESYYVSPFGFPGGSSGPVSTVIGRFVP